MERTYVVKRCKTRINFMKYIAGIFLGSHPNNMFKRLVWSVSEYGCVCFAEMGETHLKKLEGVQWRGLRVSLALMQSTHTGKVEALSGVPPLDLRFSCLNQKFLVYSYARSGDALRGRLKTLADLGRGKNIRGNRGWSHWELKLADHIQNTILGHSCVSRKL
jgi:hypothetical protein